jgi:hypothetical protein
LAKYRCPRKLAEGLSYHPASLKEIVEEAFFISCMLEHSTQTKSKYIVNRK